MNPNTAIVFSFSGGSSKGFGQNLFIKKFLQQWGVSQDDFLRHVSCFGGVSIGALLAAGYSSGKTPDELEKIFKEKSKRLFTTRSALDVALNSHNASEDSNRPNTAQKIAMIGLNDPFYKSAYPDSNYGSNVLQQVLTETFGTSTLSSLKNYFVTAAVERDISRPVYFSNFEDPTFFKGKTETIVNVCRASSAAYPYLPSYYWNGHEYIDGAFLINNVAEPAYNIALTTQPNATKIVVIFVSAGIGGNIGFDSSASSKTGQHGVSKMFEYHNMLMVNAEESIRVNFQYKASRLNRLTGKSLYFYSFQPRFPEGFSNEIDNSSESWFKSLETHIENHYFAESDKISSIISRLPTN